MRLIDADALLEYVMSGRWKLETQTSEILRIQNAPTVDTATIIQSGWISVKDRMPEPLQNVIVCTDINTVTLAWINGYEWRFADTGNGKIERYGFDVVTHWMPLPEPPKEVQDDE